MSLRATVLFRNREPEGQIPICHIYQGEHDTLLTPNLYLGHMSGCDVEFAAVPELPSILLMHFLCAKRAWFVWVEFFWLYWDCFMFPNMVSLGKWSHLLLSRLFSQINRACWLKCLDLFSVFFSISYWEMGIKTFNCNCVFIYFSL